MRPTWPPKSTRSLGRATDHGIQVLFTQRGDNLPGNLQGHEHFGFKDGISQPGIRGAVPATRVTG